MFLNTYDNKNMYTAQQQYKESIINCVHHSNGEHY